MHSKARDNGDQREHALQDEAHARMKISVDS